MVATDHAGSSLNLTKNYIVLKLKQKMGVPIITGRLRTNQPLKH